MDRKVLKEMIEPMHGKLLKGAMNQTATGISIDSRTAKEGDVFFALKGSTVDAHRFLPGAYERGCRIMVVSDPQAAQMVPDDAAVVLVADTRNAMQDLARWYMESLDIRKVAVTGSVGKTTTRDMIYSAVSLKYTAGTCRNNYNNLIGLPFAILELTGSMQVAVLEMGLETTIDEAHQIHKLAGLVNPDVAVITNIGVSHIEHYGSRENLLKEKMAITDFFGPENVLVINADDDMLATIDPLKVPFRIVRAGQSEDADFRASDIQDLGTKGVRFNLSCNQGSFPIRLSVPGAHNAVNAAIAAAAATVMGVSMEDIIAGLSQLEITGNRLRLMTIGDILVINDSYNAAPSSMESALTTLAKSEGKRKVAILGGMNELGANSDEAHRNVGCIAADTGVGLLITIGEKGRLIAEGAASVGVPGLEILQVERKEDLYPRLKELFRAGDTVLIKASRTIGLEDVAEEMERVLG